MRKLLTGGTVVTGQASIKADILIEDEKILAIGSTTELAQKFPEKAETIDVAGCLLFPGFIDAHTHFDLQVAGTVTADDFASGTKAALCGGTTTILDFATQYKGETLHQGISNWQAKARGCSSCDYGFHLAICDWNPAVEQELQAIVAEGVTSFKLYMTYDTKVNDRETFQILRRLKELGGIAGVHCENDGMIAALQQEEVAAGRMSVASHPKTRPEPAEAEAVNRLLRIAQVVDTPVIIVHLTCEESLKAIREARARGQKVYVETCPHYLLLDDSVYELPFAEAAKYVCAPPLRKQKDQEALWQALAQEEIQTMSTDHCSFTTEQKALGKDDFRKVPGGMPGVENRGVLIYTYGVAGQKITAQQMCRLLSENPAKLYGLYPQKGALEPGSDADIVVLRPGVKETLTAAQQTQKVDYTPYEGREVCAQIAKVFLRGIEAAVDGKVVRTNLGRYCPRKKFAL